MPEIDIKELSSKIKSCDISGFYLFYGDDDYTKKRCCTALTKKLSDTKNYSVRVFERHNLDVGELEDESEAMPFGCEGKLFVLRDIEADKIDSDSFERLLTLLENPAEWCVFVWVVFSAKLDMKNARWKKLRKAAEKSGSYAEFKKPDCGTAEKKLCETAKRNGCLMTRETAAYLISLAGDDMGVLINETEKICAYAGGGEITLKIVDMLVSKSTEASVYDLSKAILSRNITRAFTLIDAYFYMKIDPIIILSGITGTFVDLYRAKAVKLNGGNGKDVVAAFGYPKNLEFKANNAIRDCSRFSLMCLRKCIFKLTEADSALKGSRADPRTVLETLVCELILYIEEDNL